MPLNRRPGHTLQPHRDSGPTGPTPRRGPGPRRPRPATGCHLAAREQGRPMPQGPGLTCLLGEGRLLVNVAACKADAFREVARALEPGGRFQAVDLVLIGGLPPELANDELAWSTESAAPSQVGPIWKVCARRVWSRPSCWAAAATGHPPAPRPCTSAPASREDDQPSRHLAPCAVSGPVARRRPRQDIAFRPGRPQRLARIASRTVMPRSVRSQSLPARERDDSVSPTCVPLWKRGQGRENVGGAPHVTGEAGGEIVGRLADGAGAGERTGGCSRQQRRLTVQ
jgi:hypothetical protein